VCKEVRDAQSHLRMPGGLHVGLCLAFQFVIVIRPTQPPTLCGTENEQRPTCGDVLRLEVEAGRLIPFVDKRVGGR